MNRGKRGTSSAPATRWLERPALIAVLVVAYAATLHYAFAKNIAPLFGYAGMRYQTPAWDLYLYSLVLAVGCALLLPRRISRPSHLMLWVLYVTAAAPSILVPQYAKVLDPGPALVLALAVAGTFSMVTLGNRLPTWRGAPRVRLSSTSFWMVIGALSLLIYTVMYAKIGIGFHLVALTDVYDVRDEYKDELAASGPLLAYLLPLQANVLNPLILARGYYRRAWPLVALGLLGQIAIYSGTGFKSVLFSTPFVLAAGWMFKRNLRPSGSLVILGATAASMGALVVDKLTGAMTWTSLVIRRFLIVPGFLTAVYVVVFDPLPKAHLGHSVLEGFVEYPYQMTPPHVIGDVFFGAPEMSANANLFADGFVNFGYWGMLVEGLVLLLVLRGIDGAARNVPTPVAGLIVLMPTISLANSAVLTTITTHGLLAAAVLLTIMPRTGWARPWPRVAATGSSATNSRLAAPGSRR